MSLQGIAPQDVTVSLDGADVTAQLAVNGNRLEGSVPLVDRLFWPADGPHSVSASAASGQGNELRTYSTFFGSTSGLPVERIPLAVSDYLLIGNKNSSSSSTYFVSLLNFFNAIGYGSSIRNTGIYDVSYGDAQVLYGERHWTLPSARPSFEFESVVYQLPQLVQPFLMNLQSIPFIGGGRSEFWGVAFYFNEDAFGVYLGGSTWILFRSDGQGGLTSVDLPVTLLTAHLSATSGLNKDGEPQVPSAQCQAACDRAELIGGILTFFGGFAGGPGGFFIGGMGLAMAAAGNQCSCTLCNFFDYGCGKPVRDLTQDIGGGGPPPDCDNCTE